MVFQKSSAKRAEIARMNAFLHKISHLSPLQTLSFLSLTRACHNKVGYSGTEMKKFLAILCIAMLSSAALAQSTLSRDDLIRSLRNSAKPSSEAGTKSLDVDALRRSLRNSLTVEKSKIRTRGLRSRSLSIESKKKVQQALAGRPTVNIKIFFDYNSAAIKPESISSLMRLGQALSAPVFGQDRFLLGGHTDGKGSREYNMKLSQKRAEAVRSFLMAAFPQIAHRLVAVGFGMEQLARPDQPYDSINRRVQVMNIGK